MAENLIKKTMEEYSTMPDGDSIVINALYIVPSDYESLSKKGVLNMIKERDEGGFFDKVMTLHPFARKNNTIKISEKNLLVEYGWQASIPALNKVRLIKFFGIILILLKLFFIFPFVIKKEKISFIRATDPYLMGAIGLFYSKLFNIPLAVSIHSDYDKRYILDGAKGSFVIFGSRSLAKKLEQFVYLHCDLILPIREYMKREIEALDIVPSEKIKVFPHGISFEAFDRTQLIDVYQYFSIPKENNIISFVGRISNENYIDDIITIAKEVLAVRKDTTFLLIGGGNESERISAMLQKDLYNDRIIMAGFQSKDIVINARKQSTLSLCLMGGFSLIEACAAGRPVISYNIEWHDELVKNDETGYLIDEHDIETAVKRIIYLLEHPDVCHVMGFHARELAYDRHDLKNTTRIKQDIYKGLLYG